MFKQKTFFVIILLIAVLFLAAGCQKEASVQKSLPKATVNNAGASKYIDLPTVEKSSASTIKQARDSVSKTVEKYIQNAFLDLKLANRPDFAPQILNSFFSKKSQAAADKDFGILSLGQHGKNLQAINSNDLKIEAITLHYDESKKASLGTAQIDFKAEYKAGNNTANLKYNGWLALSKEGDGWKIFDYKVEQHLE